MDNMLTLPPDHGPVRTYWDVEFFDWDPEGDGPHASGLQAALDPTAWLGANAVPEDPACDLVGADQSCTVYSDCDDAFGETGSDCDSGACDYLYQCHQRPNWPYFLVPPLCAYDGAVNLNSLLFYWTAFTPSETCAIHDNGTPIYSATVVLDVPACAKGTYSIGFDMNQTYWTGFDSTQFTMQAVPGILNVGRICSSPFDCNDANPCTMDACVTGTYVCGYLPAPPMTPCSDANECTFGDSCQDTNGDDFVDTCVGFHFGDHLCDDFNPCTEDICNPAMGCSHVLIPACGCSPDADGDGIQDDVDGPGGEFLDESTTPYTRGGILDGGDQVLCVSDAPSPDGVRAESLGTTGSGSDPARLQLNCVGPTSTTRVGEVTTGDCITMTCKTFGTTVVASISNSCPSALASSEAAGGAAAQAAAPSDVEVELLAGGMVVGTVVLPVPNTISYDPLGLGVMAPGSNDMTLTVATPAGGSLALAPGGTVTLPPPAAIPAASTWGLAALALVLLAGAKVYFGRHRAVEE